MVQPKLPSTIQEALQVQGKFIGINKITKNNYKQFYKRGKNIQALGAVFIHDERVGVYRTATMQEVEKHIGMEIPFAKDDEQFDDKKWQSKLKEMLNEISQTLINTEKGWEENEEYVKEEHKTINEENMEAGKKLEEITNPSESEEAKYPY
tara:strand:- start:3191 stop:3643 length:453 start_codon:yes stop_codon:yes gene_type:complete